MDSVNILGVRIHTVTSDQAIKFISEKLRKREKAFIVTINPELIMQARRDAEYMNILNAADIAIADGIGVLWAARIYGYRIKSKTPLIKHIEVVLASGWITIATALRLGLAKWPISERVTGVDLSYQLAEYCAKHHFSMFLLGAAPGIADQAATRLKNTFENLKISGSFAGNGATEGDEETISELRSHPSDIVLVAYGAPKQEYWINRNLNRVPPLVAVGVGGTLMFMSGNAKRAPIVMRRIGLEWLFRLLSQPWRWRRQLALPLYMYAVIRDKLMEVN